MDVAADRAVATASIAAVVADVLKPHILVLLPVFLAPPIPHGRICESSLHHFRDLMLKLGPYFQMYA